VSNSATITNYLQSTMSVTDLATELGKRLLDTAAYIDLNLLSEMKGILERNTDLTRMGSEDIRRFLSYFYISVRNLSRPKGSMRILLNTQSGNVQLPYGTELLTKAGITYRTTSSAVLVTGTEIEVPIEQADYLSTTGIYDRFIQISTDKVDMETVELALNGVPIPRVTTPYNGFIPFYFSGQLFIKVFPGQKTAGYEGSAYTVSYAETLGLNGNIDANSVKGVSGGLRDPLTHQDVEVTIANDSIGTGAFAPTISELRNQLRFWIFSRNTVSKIPSYRSWFLSQAEVGDCLAWGDMEEMRRLGSASTQDGTVRVVLLDKQGLAIPYNDSRIAALDARLDIVRDTGVVQYITPKPCLLHISAKYVSSLDDVALFAYINKILQDAFDIDSLSAAGDSQFNDLDVSALGYQIMQHYSVPVGLEIIPRYFAQAAVNAASPINISPVLPSLDCHPGDTTYEFTTIDAPVTTTKYIEILTSPTLANIIPAAGGASVGTHDYISGVISVPRANLPAYGATGCYFKAYAETLSRAIVKNGGFAQFRTLSSPPVISKVV
jgi:hypothetical protein